MNKDKNDLQFNVSVSKRIVLFLCASVLSVILGSVIMQIVLHGGMTTPRLRISTVFQDVTFFIMPAIITAVIICRRPADFLMIGKLPHIALAVATVSAVITSIPAMNAIIEWNMSLHLPESMSGVEEWMKNAEESARKVTETLLGGTGVKSFCVALLLVGILAAFSEEIYFRGTIQRLFSTSGVNINIAIWATAIIFSAIHLQFFGFIPRLLLGAFFGYIVYWSQNLWLGILAHFTNNAIAAAGMTLVDKTEQSSAVTPNLNWFLIIGSVILTAFLIGVIKRISQTSCD